MLKTRRVRANAFLFGQDRKEVHAMEQRFLTPREAGRILRLSERTVVRLCRMGKLAGVKAGGSWRIPAEALDPEALKASGNKKGHQAD